MNINKKILNNYDIISPPWIYNNNFIDNKIPSIYNILFEETPNKIDIYIDRNSKCGLKIFFNFIYSDYILQFNYENYHYYKCWVTIKNIENKTIAYINNVSYEMNNILLYQLPTNLKHLFKKIIINDLLYKKWDYLVNLINLHTSYNKENEINKNDIKQIPTTLHLKLLQHGSYITQIKDIKYINKTYFYNI